MSLFNSAINLLAHNDSEIGITKVFPVLQLVSPFPPQQVRA